MAGGWRDSDGQTAEDRRSQRRAASAANFVNTLKRRPLTLVKPALALIFVIILALAIGLRYF